MFILTEFIGLPLILDLYLFLDFELYSLIKAKEHLERISKASGQSDESERWFEDRNKIK